MDLDPTKTPTEKIIKDEVVKRKLVFNDLGYVVLLSDKDDRTKRNPGLFLYILFGKQSLCLFTVTLNRCHPWRIFLQETIFLLPGHQTNQGG